MIYDLIELPMRDISGELSTVSPLFVYTNGMDDINWYGKSIDLSLIKQHLFKYKSVEQQGPNAIERVFYTQEPIDLKKKWWTTKIQIFPVFYKIYKWPIQAIAPVYRYLNGTQDVLDICDVYEHHNQTIYNKLAAELYPCFRNVNDMVMDPRLKLLVTGRDHDTLSMYQQAHDMMENMDRFYSMYEPLRIPSIPKDQIGDMFLHDINTKDLGLVRNRGNGWGLYTAMVADTSTPFDIDESTYFTEDNEINRWTLHDLLQTIEQSVCTDMEIVLTFEGSHRVRTQANMFSKYIGWTAREIPGFNTMKHDIVERLRKWACMTSTKPPLKVTLQKTWLEEVFIFIETEKDRGEKYYFDLAAYSLANMSFVDIFG